MLKNKYRHTKEAHIELLRQWAVDRDIAFLHGINTQAQFLGLSFDSLAAEMGVPAEDLHAWAGFRVSAARRGEIERQVIEVFLSASAKRMRGGEGARGLRGPGGGGDVVGLSAPNSRPSSGTSRRSAGGDVDSDGDEDGEDDEEDGPDGEVSIAVGGGAGAAGSSLGGVGAAGGGSGDHAAGSRNGGGSGGVGGAGVGSSSGGGGGGGGGAGGGGGDAMTPEQQFPAAAALVRRTFPSLAPALLPLVVGSLGDLSMYKYKG